ncbi:MAG: hypothetical protein GF328_13605 [Candidatus Latescibacteria bacterium]|nr:hypothetical protein [Candidatus Latescibacterota bacterium]
MASNRTASDALSQGASIISDLVNNVFGRFLDEIVGAAEEFLRDPTPGAFRTFEEEAQGTLARVAGHVVGSVISILLRDPVFRSRAMEQSRATSPRKLRNQGCRVTSVRFLGGVVLIFRTPYASPDHTNSPGRRRGVGRRGKGGEGIFPALVALGIHHRATPALASLVARLSARCASFEEASEALREHSVQMDAKTVRCLSLHVAEEALRQRENRVEAAREGRLFTKELAGKRIVVSVDGGRLRLREGGRRGRKRKNGRRGYKTPWREPKILSVYVIDGDGQKVRSFPPLLDGTLGDPDATFALLTSELVLRGASEAELVIVTGDGALWIWNRVDALAAALGIPSEKIVRVADFYHAVEHLAAMVELVTSFGKEAKKTWLKRNRRRLKKGRVDRVIESAERRCRGKNAKKIATEIDYFRKRREFMRYDEYKRRGIPRGSGAVESAVRRIVNLRLKGPAIFWRGPNAEAMLHLRAYLKAGRWDELMDRVMHRTPDGRAARVAKVAA